MSNLVRKELLKDAHPEFWMYECTLPAGESYEPELYDLEDRMQMFYFINPTGYVCTKKKAWNIEEPCLFVPNYKKDPIRIEAGEKDLRFVHFLGKMNDYDQKEYIDYHIIVPNMRGVSQSFRIQESFAGGAGSTIETRRLVLDTAFGRWFVGQDDGFGEEAFINEHSLKDLWQFIYVLPESEFNYSIDGKNFTAKEGDAFCVPKGSSYGAKPEGDKGIHTLWIKFASDGFPVGRDGYPGSEE